MLPTILYLLPLLFIFSDNSNKKAKQRGQQQVPSLAIDPSRQFLFIPVRTAESETLLAMANPMDDCNFSEIEDKAVRADLLRHALPSCQPQEGSPANTFTNSELEELQKQLPNMQIGPRAQSKVKTDFDICHQAWPSTEGPTEEDSKPSAVASPQEAPVALDWHGAPDFSLKPPCVPRAFRDDVRAGKFVGPTNAVCPGFLQCNLVVLPAGPLAFDFLLFCQRNPKSCPLIDVVNDGYCPVGIAPGSDLRTDVPMYSIYKDGKFVEDVTDATAYWPEKSVAFLIGCSFSYDEALLQAGIPLRSAEQGKNVPMFKTNLKCRPAGSLHGNVVVSMKPVSALKISKHVEITSKYTHAHGGPVCIGRPDVIGIENLDLPDWGDAVDMQPDEVPVFCQCGVTPQAVLMESKVPFAITHKAGYMFVTDMPADMGC